MKSERNILSMIRGRLMSAAVAIVSLLTVASCADEVSLMPENSDPKAGYITLDLFSTKTRADEDTTDLDNTLNEDLIRNARIYFFPGNAAQDTDKPIYSLTRTINQNESATVSVKLSNELVENLFPGNSTTAQVYVLCNIEATKVIPADATLGDLKSVVVTTSFENAITPQNPTSMFVMNGQNSVSLVRDVDNPSKSTVTGTVNLKRAAAKISLDVKLQESAEDTYGNTWVPVAGSMYALITNGVKTTAVTPSLYTPKPEDYYTTTTSDFGHRFGTPVADEEYPYQVQMPFYTYPNSWADDNEKMTYLTIMLPWRQQNGTVVRNCWYMVPVVRNETSITRNVSYHVKIDIGVLGSYEPEEPLEVQGSYEAVEWGSATVNVDIKDYRYLVVDQESYTVNNEALINIPFYSSHEVEVTDVKMTYYLYNTSNRGNEFGVEISMDQNNVSAQKNGGKGIYSYKVDNSINTQIGSRLVSFDHALYQWAPISSYGEVEINLGPTVTVNGNTPTYSYKSANELNTLIGNIWYYTPTLNEAYARYDFEITIAHSDRYDYAETIKISQYPSMYIKADHNDGGTYYGNGSVSTNPTIVSQDWGYAFVNAQFVARSGNTQAYWNNNTLGGLSSSGYTGNPNMYIITVSQLGQDDEYIIGDPRSPNINNSLAGNDAIGETGSSDAASTNWCRTAPTMQSTTERTLSFYYPTKESEETRNMIAPKFRVASSYGGMRSRVSRQDCRRRCATYQERGYPAGRWRMPTRAELKYIISLQNSLKIPILFNYNGIYMTAQGPYQVTSDGKDISEDNVYQEDNRYHVRAIYDEWYWGESVLEENNTGDYLYIYTFGDEN